MTTDAVVPDDALENQGALYICFFCRCVVPEKHARAQTEGNGRAVCEYCWEGRIEPPGQPIGEKDLARGLELAAAWERSQTWPFPPASVLKLGRV